MLFFSYFKELVGKEVTVELKNDLAITGILHSVDQYLNIKLENTRVVDEAKYPHMVFPPTSLSLSLSLQISWHCVFTMSSALVYVVCTVLLSSALLWLTL
jgi:small nuclear ribonucleoprotein (snRNP)-like protein